MMGYSAEQWCLTWARVSTTVECRRRIFWRSSVNLEQSKIRLGSLQRSAYFFTTPLFGSKPLKVCNSVKLAPYHPFTVLTLGIRRRRSGRCPISFIIDASRTGSSLRRKRKDCWASPSRARWYRAMMRIPKGMLISTEINNPFHRQSSRWILGIVIDQMGQRLLLRT